MDLLVNDFNITVSTINGSGSATANSTLLRAIYKMGVPVSGKNIFPSNIQGQPTWYTIRVSKDRYLSRLEEDHIVVALNPATIQKELDFVLPGGVLFYADHIRLPNSRNDISIYPMPVKQISQTAEVAHNLRDYIANMVYVGIVGQVLSIDMEKIYSALDFHFKGKKTAIDANWNVVCAANKWAEENIKKNDPYKIEPNNLTEGYILADGNTAAALGAIYGGVQFTAWYPITPATSLAESLNEYLPQLRRDPETGKDSFVVVQAEDELSAIGMAVGAGYAGLRAMTSTSGPGVSLMSEYLGLAYYTETPVVVWNIQRVGPSTGLPTRTAQGDLTQAYFNSHGDTQFVILLPGSVSECFEFGWKAFDLAERLQMPVIVLSDLDLGMNQWMTNKYEYPNSPMDRGKILWEDDLEKLIQDRNGDWGRYLDIDGDGIPYRTVIGNSHPNGSYFTRGTGHDAYTRYSEEPDVWEHNLDRLARKYETAKNFVPKPEIQIEHNAEFGIIAFGSTEMAVFEARSIWKINQKLTNFCRIRSIPFTTEVGDFIKTNKKIFVVEINRDGQLCQLLRMSFPEYATKFISICHIDGLPLTAKWIQNEIEQRKENL